MPKRNLEDMGIIVGEPQEPVQIRLFGKERDVAIIAHRLIEQGLIVTGTKANKTGDRFRLYGEIK